MSLLKYSYKIPAFQISENSRGTATVYERNKFIEFPGMK